MFNITSKNFSFFKIKILPQKQMLQRLLIIIAQVKVINTSENLLNKIWQIVSSFYLANELNQYRDGYNTH